MEHITLQTRLVSVYLFLLLLLLGCGDANTEQAKSYISDDGMIELYIFNRGESRRYKDDQQLHFRIPIEYLKGWTSNKAGGEQEYIKIATNLLNLKPEFSQLDDVSTKEKLNSRLLITIRPHRHNLSEAELNIRAAGKRKRFSSRALHKVRNNKNDNSIDTTVYVRQAEDMYGLEHYVSLHCRFYGKMNAQQRVKYKAMEKPDDLRIYPGADKNEYCRYQKKQYFLTEVGYENPFVLIDCNANKEAKIFKLGSCEASVRYKQWHVRYIFSGTQLYQWQEIDKNVRELLDSYWVAGPVNKF